MPGPLLAITITEVAKHGFWAGPALMIGHAVAELVTVMALAKGMSTLLKRPIAIGLIGIAGSIFLFWMAYGILTTWNNPIQTEVQSGSTSALSVSTVTAGAVVSITNPYWVLWWATVGTTYVAWSLRRGKISGLGIFFTGHILSDIAWYTIVALGVTGGATLVSPRIHQGVLLACGIALLGLAGYFIFSGMKSLLHRTSFPHTTTSAAPEPPKTPNRQSQDTPT